MGSVGGFRRISVAFQLILRGFLVALHWPKSTVHTFFCVDKSLRGEGEVCLRLVKIRSLRAAPKDDNDT